MLFTISVISNKHFYFKATTLDTDRIPYLLASGAEDMEIRVWNVVTGFCEAIFTHHTGPVNCLVITNTNLISASYDGSIFGSDLLQV